MRNVVQQLTTTQTCYCARFQNGFRAFSTCNSPSVAFHVFRSWQWLKCHRSLRFNGSVFRRCHTAQTGGVDRDRSFVDNANQCWLDLLHSRIGRVTFRVQPQIKNELAFDKTCRWIRIVPMWSHRYTRLITLHSLSPSIAGWRPFTSHVHSSIVISLRNSPEMSTELLVVQDLSTQVLRWVASLNCWILHFHNLVRMSTQILCPDCIITNRCPNQRSLKHCGSFNFPCYKARLQTHTCCPHESFWSRCLAAWFAAGSFLIASTDIKRRPDSCRISYCLTNDAGTPSAATASCWRSEGPTKAIASSESRSPGSLVFVPNTNWYGEYPPRCKQVRKLKHPVVSQTQQNEFRDFSWADFESTWRSTVPVCQGPSVSLTWCCAMLHTHLLNLSSKHSVKLRTAIWNENLWCVERQPQQSKSQPHICGSQILPGERLIRRFETWSIRFSDTEVLTYKSAWNVSTPSSSSGTWSSVRYGLDNKTVPWHSWSPVEVIWLLAKLSWTDRDVDDRGWRVNKSTLLFHGPMHWESCARRSPQIFSLTCDWQVVQVNWFCLDVNFQVINCRKSVTNSCSKIKWMLFRWIEKNAHHDMKDRRGSSRQCCRVCVADMSWSLLTAKSCRDSLEEAQKKRKLWLSCSCCSASRRGKSTKRDDSIRDSEFLRVGSLTFPLSQKFTQPPPTTLNFNLNLGTLPSLIQPGSVKSNGMWPKLFDKDET